MMKVDRYLYGRTNVEQLKSGRAALRSPEEVAAEAYAPYGAVSDIAGAVSDAIVVEDQRRKKIQDEEDAIEAKITGVKLKSGTSSVLSDPKFDNRMQPDGTPSASLMLEEYEGVAKIAKESLSNIQNPKTRANAERLLNVSIEEGRLAVRSAANDKSEDWNAQAKFDLRKVAFEAEDWEFFSQINSELRDSEQISQTQYSAAENAVEAKQKEIFVQDKMDGYEQRIAAGQGRDVLSEVLANPNEDKETQKLLVAGIKAQTYNYELVEQKQKDAVVATWMRETDNLINSIATEGAEINIDSLYKTMLGTGVDPIKAATLANRVSAAQRSKTVKDDGYEIFKASVSMGEPVDNDKGNRVHTDRYAAAQLELNEQLPDDDPNKQRPIDVLINTYKTTGLVGERWQTRLESASTEEGMARSAEFWSALHSDPYRTIEDGLSPERRGIYQMINLRAQDGGMSWVDASRDVLDITKVDPIKREVRKQEWIDDEGGDKAGNYYVDLIDSNHYDKMSGMRIPFYGRFELENHEENKARYRMFLQDGYDLAGNWPDAKVHADEVFKDSHVLTNINGKSELQVGGIPSDLGNGSSVDLSPLRDQFIEGIKGQQMMFTNVDGSTKLGTIDSAEGITLDDPEKILGEWVYMVSQNGNRIVNPKTGLQLEVSYDNLDLYQLQVSQSKDWDEKQFRESQVQLQSDIDALSGKISFGKKVSKDMSTEERLLQGKEEVMMEKERQRKLETSAAPEF
jgi:hypothetical protein